MSIASKKLALAAIAGLMTVGFASQASATANPYPQGYLGNGTAVEKNGCQGQNGCKAAGSCHGEKAKSEVAPKPHHKKHHKKAAPAPTAAPAPAPAPKAPAKH